jgi:hypothetical protein
MNKEYRHLVPADFPDDARVWVYQSSRLFSIGEALEIEAMLERFVSEWKSHGHPVRGFATLFFGRFLVLMADESSAGVSGCSTDASVRMVKEIEQRFRVSMFDRQSLAFIVKDKVELLPMGQLSYALQQGFIDAGTPYFNNLVGTKRELLEKWIVPLGESWLSARLGVKP